MAKKRAFEHESIQDRESIVAYLKAVTRGISNGTLKLADGDSRIELSPDGLLTLSVRASRKRNRTRLDLRISWREPTDDEPGKLRIEGPK